MDEGERSAVLRSLMTKAWPLMASADPGRTRDVVTPPDMDRAYESSCVFKPSKLRIHGTIVPFNLQRETFRKIQALKAVRNARITVARTIQRRTRCEFDKLTLRKHFETYNHLQDGNGYPQFPVRPSDL